MYTITHCVLHNIIKILWYIFCKYFQYYMFSVLYIIYTWFRNTNVCLQFIFQCSNFVYYVFEYIHKLFLTLQTTTKSHCEKFMNFYEYVLH